MTLEGAATVIQPSLLSAAMLLMAGALPAGSEIGRVDGPEPVQAPFELPAEAVQTGAGCAAVRIHILPDGSVAHPRVLQDGFTPDVGDAQRTSFRQAAIDSLRRWRYSPEADRPVRSVLQVVGFVPAAAGGPREAVGLDAQDANVRAACRIESLPAWGEANAIPVEAAAARNDSDVLVPRSGEASDLWLTVDATPPGYPMSAVANRINACFLVGVLVGPDGRVGDMRILAGKQRPWADSYVRKDLHEAVSRQVGRWKFSPGPENLDRRRALLAMPVKFEVGNGRIDCPVVEDPAKAFADAAP